MLSSIKCRLLRFPTDRPTDRIAVSVAIPTCITIHRYGKLPGIVAAEVKAQPKPWVSAINRLLKLGQGSIDATGAIDGGSLVTTYDEPSCGTYSMAISGGFFGRDLRISVAATSRTCYNFNFTATLT